MDVANDLLAAETGGPPPGTVALADVTVDASMRWLEYGVGLIALGAAILLAFVRG